MQEKKAGTRRGAPSLVRARGRHVRATQVSGVTSMRYMFREARAFNQPIDSWDVRDPRRLERAFPGRAR